MQNYAKILWVILIRMFLFILYIYCLFCIGTVFSVMFMMMSGVEWSIVFLWACVCKRDLFSLLEDVRVRIGVDGVSFLYDYL